MPYLTEFWGHKHTGLGFSNIYMGQCGWAKCSIYITLCNRYKKACKLLWWSPNRMRTCAHHLSGRLVHLFFCLKCQSQLCQDALVNYIRHFFRCRFSGESWNTLCGFKFSKSSITKHISVGILSFRGSCISFIPSVCLPASTSCSDIVRRVHRRGAHGLILTSLVLFCLQVLLSTRYLWSHRDRELPALLQSKWQLH